MLWLGERTGALCANCERSMRLKMMLSSWRISDCRMLFSDNTPLRSIDSAIAGSGEPPSLCAKRGSACRHRHLGIGHLSRLTPPFNPANTKVVLCPIPFHQRRR